MSCKLALLHHNTIHLPAKSMQKFQADSWGYPFSSSALVCACLVFSLEFRSHLLAQTIRFSATLLFFFFRTILLRVMDSNQTDLKNWQPRFCSKGHIYLAHMTAQIKMLDPKTITHPNQNSLGIPSTIVVEFLVLGALGLLGRCLLLWLLLLWSLQIQWLCVVMGEGLGVERIHQTLQVTHL